MPPHLSDLLQPLDVGCFSPLKHAYKSQISDLARKSIGRITKTDFLSAFKSAFFKAFTKENICGSFGGAGLVPFDPNIVILRLDLWLRTPTPPAGESVWELKTPSNPCEFPFLRMVTKLVFEKFHQLMRIRRHWRHRTLLCHFCLLLECEKSRRFCIFRGRTEER